MDVNWIAVSFIGFGVLCTIAELVRPARKLHYFQRDALPFDLVSLAVVQLAFAPLALYVANPVAAHVQRYMPASIYALPLVPRVIAVYVVADLVGYWMHRLYHTRQLWRIHRYHHSPTQLYWLAGVRVTAPQLILTNLPVALVVPLISDAPDWVFVAFVIATVVTNHWMHVNVSWRSNWLEKVFVTPRSHHVHHATDAKLQHGNYGVVFSVWDRLFGTYVDPDVATPKKFGTGEKKRDPVLLMIGI